MREADPILKWVIPALVGLVLLAALSRQIKRSDRWRWFTSFLVSLGVAPVVIPGCPGLSVEPAWLVLSSVRLDELFYMLFSEMGLFVLIPIGVTTGVIGPVLDVCCRKFGRALP